MFYIAQRIWFFFAHTCEEKRSYHKVMIISEGESNRSRNRIYVYIINKSKLIVFVCFFYSVLKLFFKAHTSNIFAVYSVTAGEHDSRQKNPNTNRQADSVFNNPKEIKTYSWQRDKQEHVRLKQQVQEQNKDKTKHINRKRA